MPLALLTSSPRDTANFPIVALTIAGASGAVLTGARTDSALELRVQGVTWEDETTGDQGAADDGDATVYAALAGITAASDGAPQQLTYTEPSGTVPAGSWTGVLPESGLAGGHGRFRVTVSVYGPDGSSGTLRFTKTQIVQAQNP